MTISHDFLGASECDIQRGKRLRNQISGYFSLYAKYAEIRKMLMLNYVRHAADGHDSPEMHHLKKAYKEIKSNVQLSKEWKERFETDYMDDEKLPLFLALARNINQSPTSINMFKWPSRTNSQKEFLEQTIWPALKNPAITISDLKLKTPTPSTKTSNETADILTFPKK